MSNYYTEGVVKSVTVEGTNVFFALEPTAPYVFETKKEDGTTERCLLFIEEVDESSETQNTNTESSNSKDGNGTDENKNWVEARIVDAKCKFSASGLEYLHSLIVAKANRMRVKIKVQTFEKQHTAVAKMEI